MEITPLLPTNIYKNLFSILIFSTVIRMVLAGQQGGGGQMIKKFAPWIIGTIILLSASSICSYFLGDLSFEVTMAPVIEQGIENIVDATAVLGVA